MNDFLVDWLFVAIHRLVALQANPLPHGLHAQSEDGRRFSLHSVFPEVSLRVHGRQLRRGLDDVEPLAFRRSPHQLPEAQHRLVGLAPIHLAETLGADAVHFLDALHRNLRVARPNGLEQKLLANLSPLRKLVRRVAPDTRQQLLPSGLPETLLRELHTRFGRSLATDHGHDPGGKLRVISNLQLLSATQFFQVALPDGNSIADRCQGLSSSHALLALLAKLKPEALTCALPQLEL
mmetsp:Transcript_89907/g.253562  ORF Transcript_89907/g.253562 Transcript_89907/m.253562 type:complete len:236 (-) Transcript_89907:100-807(-)